MNKEDKPLGEWTLGEVREVCDGYSICGDCPFCLDGGECVVDITPNRWDLEYIPKFPALTEAERDIMWAMGAKWVSRGENGGEYVDLWGVKPLCVKGNFFSEDGKPPVACAVGACFPSVEPGDCIELEGEE